MDRPTALIVGAGIGGLAAGIALDRAGWQVRIFERAESPRELGFALNLAPNAIAALRELGLGDRMVAEGNATTSAEVRRADGRVLKRLSLAAPVGVTPPVVVLRPVLHGALLNATRPEALVLSSEAVGFDITKTGVALNFRDGRSAVGDILVGADGAGSVVRTRLHPREPPPRRSGFVGIRGVAHDAEHYLGNLSAVVYYGHGVEAATARAGKGAVYWYLSLLAEDVPAEMRPPHAVVERYAASLDDGFRAIANATRPEDVRVDDLFDRDPIDNWGSGPVTLLGDAAHPMLPHTGQGAAQALEDAVALGLALASRDDTAGALRKYEHIRSARTRSIVKRGRQIARFTTTKSAVVGAFRTAIFRMVPARFIAAAFMLADRTDPHRALRTSTIP